MVSSKFVPLGRSARTPSEQRGDPASPRRRLGRWPSDGQRTLGTRDMSPPKLRERSTNAVRVVGAAMTSCTGAGSAVFIASAHGSTMMALLVFGTMQIWGVCELLFRWRLKWRHARLHEFLVRKAADNPDNENLRTLLVDFASTHLDDVGERLPIRPSLKRSSSPKDHY
jgi:hypothetical protein